MIGYISLFEGIGWFHSLVWAVSTMEFIEYFGLMYGFKYTVMFSGSLNDSWIRLWQLNQILGYEFFQIMSLGMNICLWIDLILTLRAPLYPPAKRLKFYLLFSFLLAISLSITTIKNSKETCLFPTYAYDSEAQNISLVCVVTLYFIVAVTSILYAFKILWRPGISSEIRQIFMRKHIIYTITLLVLWFIVSLNAYVELFTTGSYTDESSDEEYEQASVQFPDGVVYKVWIYKDGDDDQSYIELKPLHLASFIASISICLVMGMIRCFEPYLIYLTKRTILTLYGIPWSQKSMKSKLELTDTIAQYLNSSLNIELVYIILKSITHLWGEKSVPLNDFELFVPVDAHFNDKKEFELNEIEISDMQNWNLLISTQRRNNMSGYNELEEEDTLILQERIRVVELAPKIFSIIRSRDGITNQDVIDSLSPEFNSKNVFKAGKSQGRSGSFFFLSHNK